MHLVAIAALVALVISVAPQANAHGYIAVPAATYRNDSLKTTFNAIITETIDPAVFHGYNWSDPVPEHNSQAFAERFNASKYASLRALLDPVVPDCANSRTDVPPVDVSNLTTLTFQNYNKEKQLEGFTKTHHGPCEIWIDTKRVFHGDDCATQFTEIPALVPVNYSACPSGKSCTLTLYWLAVHEANWQFYKQCVPITRHAAPTKSTYRASPQLCQTLRDVVALLRKVPSTADAVQAKEASIMEICS